MRKDDKIEFRCPTTMKRWLLGCRPLVGARTLSHAARILLEGLMNNLDGGNLWGAIPALKEIALHLDRIACALQRCLLEGNSPQENLTDLSHRLDHVRALLDALTAARPGGPQLDR